MDTMTAFAMGQANRDKDEMVFDWDKAAQILKERRPQSAEAGLQGDLGFTGGAIWEDGKPVTEDYTYLASTWAPPVLIIGGKEIECYKMDTETDWDCSTKWPESALNILNN